MKRKTTLETLIAYWPLVVCLVGMIGSVYTLQMRVANAEDVNREQQEWLIKQSTSNQALQVSSARTEEKIDSILEALRDIKTRGR